MMVLVLGNDAKNGIASSRPHCHHSYSRIFSTQHHHQHDCLYDDQGPHGEQRTAISSLVQLPSKPTNVSNHCHYHCPSRTQLLPWQQLLLLLCFLPPPAQDSCCYHNIPQLSSLLPWQLSPSPWYNINNHILATLLLSSFFCCCHCHLLSQAMSVPAPPLPQLYSSYCHHSHCYNNYFDEEHRSPHC